MAQVAQDIHDMKEGIDSMNDPKKKGDKKKGWFWSLLGGIGSIASGIMSFMGSIGSIGAIALGIYGILKAAFGDKSKGGKSQQLTHSEQAGRAAEYGVKKTSYFLGRHPRALMAVAKAPFELAKGIGKGITKLPVVGSVAESAKNVIEDNVSNFTSKLKNKIGGSASKDKKFSQLIIEKIQGALTKFTKSDIFINVFGKEPGRISKFIKGIGEIAGKIADPKILDVLRKRFPKKVAEATAKTGVAATGVGLVLTVGFGIYDGITGALEADRLFDVNPADVTMKMRLVSTFVNAFFGLPPMMWIDLILTAASFGALALSDTMFGKAMQAAGYDLKDFDHRKIFARYIFDLISDESESSKLTNDQKKFDDEVKAYADKHNKGADFSKEQYREETDNKTTWQKYGAPLVDKVLGIGQDTKTGIKSFGERISGWLDDMTRWFRDVVKSITSFSPMDWFKELIGLPKDWSLGGAFQRIGDRLNNWLPDIHPADKTTKTTGGLWAKAKGAAGAVKNYFFGSANGYQYMNDAKWKDSFGKDGCGPMTLAGIPYRENKSPSDLLNALRSGAPTAIGGSSSNPNSPFYGNGHYIMAKGMDANGNVNIVNPTSSSKSTSIGLKQLMKESIGNGGYSGSFIGAGRMSLAEAQKVQNEVQGDKAKLSAIKELPGSSDFSNLKELEPSDIKKLTAGDTVPAASNMAMLDSYNQRNRARNSKAAIARQLDIAKKAKNNPKYNLTGSKPNANNGKIGFGGLLMGIGLGLKNLFSAIWGGTKYQNVSISDVLGGVGSMFKGLLGGKNIGVSGKGCDTGIRAAQCALAHPDGEQWMGTVTTDSNIQCDSYAREIYKEAGLEMPRMVVTDEDFKARSAYFPNDGSYEPELGDLVDWPKHVGIYVGGHNVNSRQSKGGVHTLSFEDAEKIWGPIHGFGSVSKYTGEPVHEVHGGGGGSFDSASGNLEDKQKVWSYLVNDLGMNRAGAAGVMGNIQKESSFRTAAIGDGGTSGGLVQWHDESPGVGRFTNLKNFAASQGLPFESLDAQLGYLGQELNDGYRGVYNKVKNASSVEYK